MAFLGIWYSSRSVKFVNCYIWNKFFCKLLTKELLSYLVFYIYGRSSSIKILRKNFFRKLFTEELISYLVIYIYGRTSSVFNNLHLRKKFFRK